MNLYKELEFFGRANYFPKAGETENIMGRLMSLPVLSKYREELDYCRVVRNFLTHNPKVGGDYPLEPSERMIQFMEDLRTRVSQPETVMEICVKRRDMLTVNTTDKLLSVMSKMRDKNYTHAPVFHKNKFLGILSEATLSSYYLTNRSLQLDADCTVDTLSDVIDYNFGENSRRLIFVAEDTLTEELREAFEDRNMRSAPIAAAFVTKSGKRGDVILGMVTPHDLIG